MALAAFAILYIGGNSSSSYFIIACMVCTMGGFILDEVIMGEEFIVERIWNLIAKLFNKPPLE